MSRFRVEMVIRVTTGLVGIGMAVAGARAVFLPESHAAGSVALLGFGAVLLLLAGLMDRLESLRYGDLEIVLRQKAREAARRGDLRGAEALELAADTVSQRVARVSRSYKSVRSSMPASPERTMEMTQMIENAKREAHAHDIKQEDVLSRLWTGPEGARVWALGVLQARPELATPRAVLDAVNRPDEMYEQYHALLLADLFVQLDSTRTWQRERIAKAVSNLVESDALGQDQDCLKLADSVIKHASPPSRP